MGVKMEIYFGPYLDVEPKTVQTTMNRYSCGTIGCQLEKYHHDNVDKFCKLCGAPLKVFDLGEKDEIFHVENEPDYDTRVLDIMFSPEHDDYIFIPNKGGVDAKWSDSDEWETLSLITPEFNIAESLRKMQSHPEYKKFMEYLTEKGYKFKVDFGIVKIWW